MKTSMHIAPMLSETPSAPSPLRFRLLFLPVATLMVLFAPQGTVFAGSATWKTSPGSGDWTTASNWTPSTVPNGSTDTATFDLSNTTNVSLSANSITEVSGIVFKASASAYTLTFNSLLRINGVGITDNSGIQQNFVTPGGIQFLNGATAGTGTIFTNRGDLEFYGSGSAGGGIFINNGGRTLFPGETSTADNGTFINNGGNLTSNAFGGETIFFLKEHRKVEEQQATIIELKSSAAKQRIASAKQDTMIAQQPRLRRLEHREQLDAVDHS
jgi:hypothetical protein